MFYVFYPFLYINVYLHKKATLQLYVTVSAAFGQVKSKSYLLFLCHVFLLTFIMFLLFILFGMLLFLLLTFIIVILTIIVIIVVIITIIIVIIVVLFKFVLDIFGRCRLRRRLPCCFFWVISLFALATAVLGL